MVAYAKGNKIHILRFEDEKELCEFENNAVDFDITHMQWGNHNRALIVADGKGNVRVLKFKDNQVMQDSKNIPKATKLFNEDCKITGIIFDDPNIVAVNDKG